MSLGRRDGQRQESLWIVSTDIARALGHPFYSRLNEVLAEAESFWTLRGAERVFSCRTNVRYAGV